MIETRFVRPALPPDVATPCGAPVRLPDRALSPRDIVPLWARDRAALKLCAARHGALVEAVR